MTVILTANSPFGVVLAADSAVTRDFADVREYDTGRKHWHIPGIGFVATWGARDGNEIGRHLERNWPAASGRGIRDLACSVHQYLVGTYRPDERESDDVGYHVAGITPDGMPAVFHSYYNAARDDVFPHYDLQFIGPRPGISHYLYNGRNDIAHNLVTTLINEARFGKDARFRGESIAEIAHLAHFILRTVAEITPSVGPPYILSAKHISGEEVKLRYEHSTVPLEQFRCDFAAAN
jgi:hypothetical protein